jgi:excisionase family DNA binding protein
MNDVLDEVEVAEILDCEPKTVQEKARLGELPAIKFGRSWRFPRAALMQSLNDLALSNKAKARPAPMATSIQEGKKQTIRRKLPVLAAIPT